MTLAKGTIAILLLAWCCSRGRTETQCQNEASSFERLQRLVTNIARDQMQLSEEIRKEVDILTEKVKVLQRQSDDHLAGCSNGRRWIDGSIYYLSNTAKNWSDASAACRSCNAVLVEIESSEKNRFVRDLLGENSVAWIGLRDVQNGQQSSSFEWNSGQTIVYSNWVNEEPSRTTRCSGGRKESCGEIYGFTTFEQCEYYGVEVGWTGNPPWLREYCRHIINEQKLWNDNCCELRKPFVCQKRASTV